MYSGRSITHTILLTSKAWILKMKSSSVLKPSGLRMLWASSVECLYILVQHCEYILSLMRIALRASSWLRTYSCPVCIVDKPLYIYTHRSKSLSKDYYRNHISQYIDNRILRLELVDNIIRERFPHLQKYSTYHCIFYYNELIGRICLFPHLYRDPRVNKVISYIRNHSDVLRAHHNQLGFSKWGVHAIMYIPQSLYLYYRKWK